MTSARTNYLVFETREPFADVEFAHKQLPPECQRAADVCRDGAAQDPRYNQIYLRYLGPI